MLIAPVVAAMVGCSGRNIIPERPAADGEIKIFTASVSEVGDATRVRLDGLTPSWQVGDVISVDGHEYVSMSEGPEAGFAGSGATEVLHHAWFPASLYDDGNLALPAVQPFSPGHFDMPMYAVSETDQLYFKNICAVLALKITSADIPSLKSIKVTSNKAMCGAFIMQGDKAVLVDSTPSDATMAVVMECRETVELDAEGTTFYIAIPAQSYEYLNMYISSDGQTYNELMATTKAEGVGEIARNKIVSIDYERSAVRLYANGPYWATKYVGVKSEMDYGGHMEWNFTYPDMISSSNWSMPEVYDVYDLIGKCDYSNYVFRGKTAPYSDYHIYIAPSGFTPFNSSPVGVGTKSYFWTRSFYSIEHDTVYVWCFSADGTHADASWLTADDERYHGGDRCPLRLLIR